MENAMTMDMKIAFLKKQTVFSQLHDEELTILAGLLKETSIPNGETIVKEGDLIDSVYIIAEGKARVIHLKRDANKNITEELVATLNEGQSIGLSDTGFFSLSGKRSATVVADSNMILLRLSVAAFHGFSLAHTHVSQVMREAMEKMMGFTHANDQF